MRALRFLLASLMVGLTLSCVSTQCAQPTVDAIPSPAPDARNVPLTSFALIAGQQMFVPKCADTKCEMNYRTGSASGVFVKRSATHPELGFVMTANHFCTFKDALEEGEEEVLRDFVVIDYNAKAHKASVALSFPDIDVCIMVIQDMDDTISIAQPASQMPNVGEWVFNVAAPWGFFSKQQALIYPGLVTGDKKVSDVPVTIYTFYAAPGSSGSGVFNNRGQLIGMAKMIPTVRGHIVENVAVATTLDDIKRVLKELGPINDMFDVGRAKTSTLSE